MLVNHLTSTRCRVSQNTKFPRGTFTPPTSTLAPEHTMEDVTSELTDRFERYCNTKDKDIPSEVLTELELMTRLYNISAEELDFKWQAYSMKIGGDDNKLDLKTARDFKKTLQDALEKESRGKVQQRSDAKRVAPTPRAAKGGDMYDMYVVFKYGES
jgi:DNA polymerase alpha subunit B